MSWQYSGDPSISEKDAVRYLIGDTRADAPQVQDEEIEYVLSISYGSIYNAASRVAETIAARYARDIDSSIGEFREQAAQRQEHYERLAAMLRGATGGGAAGSNTPGIFFGGLSDIYGNVVPPAFTRDMT
jgi:hypothetical protein